MKNKDKNPNQEKRITLVFSPNTREEIKEIKKISSFTTIRAIIIQAIHILFIILRAKKDGYKRVQLINPDEPNSAPKEVIV